ncbi:uncharacterized protein C8Q71DRAFT_479358 [Rhodofomes roseus]|uniref:Uncharacterized protein n=1 Tax=Rhodofomes roseus TaxID=34475 RepID=A0ABQ8KQE9_9APHY|nr:uncharacterized protein C8Q71DRAFT_479358 [Rhodofomes roseus]KAH9840156.1 hypothetical protein C8Q71DRAFT_479358 [Rhodofomes roseus]
MRTPRRRHYFGRVPCRWQRRLPAGVRVAGYRNRQTSVAETYSEPQPYTIRGRGLVKPPVANTTSFCHPWIYSRNFTVSSVSMHASVETKIAPMRLSASDGREYVRVVSSINVLPNYTIVLYGPLGWPTPRCQPENAINRIGRIRQVAWMDPWTCTASGKGISEDNTKADVIMDRATKAARGLPLLLLPHSNPYNTDPSS